MTRERIDTAEAAPSVRGSSTAAVGAILISLVTAIALYSVWDFTTDDAFITLRYARHLAEGHGLVWNVGEAPIEGYSNFLFVILGALAMRLSIDPIVAYKVLCIVALFATLVVVYRIGRLWMQPAASLLPVAMIAAQPGNIWWTISGLETAVFQLTFVASHACCLYGLGFRPIAAETTNIESPNKPTERRYRPTLLAVGGLFVLVGSLTRPEGPLMGISMALVIVATAFLRSRKPGTGNTKGGLRRNLGPLLLLGVLPGLLYAAYFVWRYFYFGQLLPNSVACKSPGGAGGSLVLVRQYWNVAWIPMVLILLRPRQRFDFRDAMLVLPSLLYTLALWNANPILGHMNRHFLPVFALLVIPAAVSAVRLASQVLVVMPRWRKEAWALAVGLLLVCLNAVDPRLSGTVGVYLQRTAVRAETAAWLADKVGPRAEVVAGDVGIFGYVGDLRIRDAYCLNSIYMTDPAIDRDAAKYADLILLQQPDAFAFISTHQDEIRAAEPVWQEFLDDPRFAENYRWQKTFIADTYFNYFIFLRNDLAQPRLQVSAKTPEDIDTGDRVPLEPSR